MNSHLPLGFRFDGELGGGGAAECNLRAVDTEYLRIAAWCALTRGNDGSRQEPEFHQAPGIVSGKVDAVQDGMIAFTQVEEGAGCWIATELQHVGRPGGFLATNWAGLGHLSLHD